MTVHQNDKHCPGCLNLIRACIHVAALSNRCEACDNTGYVQEDHASRTLSGSTVIDHCVCWMADPVNWDYHADPNQNIWVIRFTVPPTPAVEPDAESDGADSAIHGDNTPKDHWENIGATTEATPNEEPAFA